jgi:hypothetical protein
MTVFEGRRPIVQVISPNSPTGVRVRVQHFEHASADEMFHYFIPAAVIDAEIRALARLERIHRRRRRRCLAPRNRHERWRPPAETPLSKMTEAQRTEYIFTRFFNVLQRLGQGLGIAEAKK